MASFETRGNSTRAIVRLPGGGKITASFPTKAEARAWAIDKERLKKSGKLSTSGTRIVGDIFKVYLPIAEATDTGKWNKIRLLKFMDDPISTTPLGAITTHDINEWIDRRLKEKAFRSEQLVSPSTVNRELNLLGGAFTYAVDTLKWMDENPCHGCKRPAPAPPRDRKLLTPYQLAMIERATGMDTDPELHTITARVGATFFIALESGMRSGEILRVRPRDYVRDERYVLVSATERGGRKGARSGRNTSKAWRKAVCTDRAIELWDRLLATMPEEQKPADGFSDPPYIVGANDAQRDALWRKARDKTGIEDLKYHDTKHEAATRLARFLDVLALSHTLGTKDLKLLRDTYYNNDVQRAAALLPAQLAPEPERPALADE